jgi:hypothetical protein
MQARVVLRNKEPDRALTLLNPILKEPGAVTTPVKLTYAEALATHKGVTAKERDTAKGIISSLKEDASVSVGELGRIAALIEPGLPRELGLPKPSDDGEAAPILTPKKRPKRR